MKVYCNLCFQPLVLHEYPEGHYADMCQCITKEIEEKETASFNEGYDVGYDVGVDDNYNNDDDKD